MKRTLVAVAIVAALGAGSVWAVSTGPAGRAAARVERALGGSGGFDHRAPASVVRLLGFGSLNMHPGTQVGILRFLFGGPNGFDHRAPASVVRLLGFGNGNMHPLAPVGIARLLVGGTSGFDHRAPAGIVRLLGFGSGNM
jgi:hypothetical protein